MVRQLGAYLEHMQDLPAAADYMSYAKNTVLGDAGFGSFIVDYCNAKEYTDTEKSKKKIAGFCFVVQNGTGNDFSKAEVYIMGRDALSLSATSPHPQLGVQLISSGFTQQTPSVGIK